MSKTLKKLTILVVLTIAVVGSILGGLSATANAQSDDEDALRAEVEAVARQLGEALNTSDGELFDTLWLQSDKTTYFPLPNPSGYTDGPRYDNLLLDSLAFHLGPSTSLLDKSVSTWLAMTWRSGLAILFLGSGRQGERRGQ